MSSGKHLALVPLLVGGFPKWVAYYGANAPFKRPDQLTLHQKTISLRNSHASVSAALGDVVFIESLYDTLRAWGIGSRGSQLKPVGDFTAALRAAGQRLARLDGLAIDDPHLNTEDTVAELWNIIGGLGIVANDTPLVSGTKAVHHLLPRLVPPMDRAYTQQFFGWNNPRFQYGQEKCFQQAFSAMTVVAREVEPHRFVGSHPWHTSVSKVLDNALVGLLCAIRDQKLEAT